MQNCSVIISTETNGLMLYRGSGSGHMYESSLNESEYIVNESECMK